MLQQLIDYINEQNLSDEELAETAVAKIGRQKNETICAAVFLIEANVVRSSIMNRSSSFEHRTITFTTEAEAQNFAVLKARMLKRSRKIESLIVFRLEDRDIVFDE